MHDRKEETMLKDIKEYSAEEVGLWVTAQGLDPSKFVSEGVDGDLLLSLSIDDLKNDLGLSSLLAKKVMKNIEFSKSLTEGNGGGEDSEKVKVLAAEKKELEAKVETLENDIKAKDHEIAELKKKMEEMKVGKEKAAAPAPTPAPKQAPAPTHRGPGVVGGAARGAAGGAMKGAIAGAILPGMDAADGAKAGAAVGATSGGLRAMRGRRL